MKKCRILGGMATAAAVAVFAAMPVYAKDTVIPDGIYVGDFSLGGKTEEEAGQEIRTYVDDMADRKVTLDLDGETIDTTVGELGVSWGNAEAVEEAAKQLAGGNLIQQYMSRKDLEKEPMRLPLELAVDAELLDTLVKENCEGLEGEPLDAAIARVDGEFVITPGKAGKVVDAAATGELLSEALTKTADGAVSVKAAVTVEEPEITEEDLASIQDVLGTFSTDFSSSGAARSGNLENGASKINGHVLMPGETLSGYECMQPLTTANGYYTAGSYENGRVVDSVGGGVCQIATTLYNAALYSELEITQRQNHSMIVSYVKPSMDAAIAGTYKDIKITNNYSTPIYVEGGISGRTLTFTIYGKETRPANRTLEFVSETLSVIDPGAPAERVDASLSPGARRQVQSAHRGLKSRLWKVVKVDGVETERELLSTDTYNASKAIVLVGPSAPAAVPETPAATDPAGMQETESQPVETQPSVVEGVNGGPGVTAAQTEAAAAGPEAVQEAEAPAPAAPEAPAEAPAAETPAAPAPAETPAAPAPVETPAAPAES